jgi:hypothetical protein
MTLRDTMENWQSEFLQLAWQVGGLSILWAVASPQSKSENDRLEDKLDILIKRIDPENAKQLLAELERKISKEIVVRRTWNNSRNGLRTKLHQAILYTRSTFRIIVEYYLSSCPLRS